MARGSLSTDPAAAGALLEAHNLQALARIAAGGGEPQVLALQVRANFREFEFKFKTESLILKQRV